MGMGINHWEWEGMGLKKIFSLTSTGTVALLVSVLIAVSRRSLCGSADSRVDKSLDCGARGPGLESRCRRKVLGSDGIICKYLPS